MRSLEKQLLSVITLGDYSKQLQLKDLSPASIEKYKQQLSFFYDWLGEREPSADLAKLFLADLRQKGYSRASIRALRCHQALP